MLYVYNEPSYYIAFVLGFFSSIHCFGMCAGISTFLSYNTSGNNSYYILFLNHLLYNVGRIFSYIVLSFVSTSIGFFLFGSVSKIFLILFSNIVLIFIGLYLLGFMFFLKKIESLGFFFWNQLSPLKKKLFPIKNPFYSFFIGIIWGYIPCGLVYSNLLLTFGFLSFKKSFLFMLFFGLGTFPMMLFIGIYSLKLIHFIQNIFIRFFFGFIIIFIAIFNIFSIKDSCI